VAEIIEDEMAQVVDRYLDQLSLEDGPDRRNGYYPRHLLTTLGDIELAVPRTRRYSPVSVLRAYARREAEIDRVMLAGFVLGLSTRKVGETLLAILGQRVSATTVSRVAKTLDAAVSAFHRRSLNNHYRVLMLDGVVLARKTGAGALRRPVLVALGLRPDGKKEVIDFRLAKSESAAEWERFLTDLYRRGLTGEGIEMVCVDGGSGLIAALPTAFPDIPIQRCWAHKIRNVLNKVRRADQPKVKRSPQDHERAQSAGCACCGATVHQPSREPISCRRHLSAQRSRRASHLFPLQMPRSAQGGENHQRHRTPIPRSQTTHPPDGHLSGHNLHGPDLVRRLHP
jgi:putative transposase